MDHEKINILSVGGEATTFEEYKEQVAHALEIVELHFREENPDDIERAMRLYADDVVWEVPGRRVRYVGKEDVKRNYLRLFASAEGMQFEPIERFATSERVVDDMWVRFTLSGDGFANAPFPIGTKVKMRLVHIFDIRDGYITREAGYEMWLKDED